MSPRTDIPMPSPREGKVPQPPSAGGLVVVQTAFPGDVILIGGLIRSIREGWPSLPLALVVRPDTAPLARMMDPDLEVLVFDKRGGGGGPDREDEERGGLDQAGLIRRLREGPWEGVLLPHRSARSAWIARRAGLAPRVGFGLTPTALLYTRSVPYRRGIHEIERAFDLLGALARTWQADLPPFRLPLLQITPRGTEEAEDFFAGMGDPGTPLPFAALAPGSVWATKRWPEGYWARLAGMLGEGGLEVVLIGGPADAGRCRRIAERAGAGHAAAGSLSWEGTAALLDRALLLVSGDSAPVHLAGAVRCPVVALFGPTVPGFGFAPIGAGSRSVGMPLGCRPCRLHGSGACPEGHFRCMYDMSPEHVADAVADTLEALHGSSDPPSEDDDV
ncbi:MAG: glycosyltransferase family 9 protein [bacterium]